MSVKSKHRGRRSSKMEEEKREKEELRPSEITISKTSESKGSQGWFISPIATKQATARATTNIFMVSRVLFLEY